MRQRRRILREALAHDRPRALFDLGDQLEQLRALARVRLARIQRDDIEERAYGLFIRAAARV